MKGDGCNLSFADKAFDIGYSNSVIEHLGTFENQRRFASEVSRVARGVWVQTPAKAFFIEPHYLAPFVHWLPKSVRRRLIRWFTIWGLVTKPGPQQVDEILAEIRLLTRREMADLFPDCEIVTERFFFWPKAYVAVRRLK